jgi:enoyl-CoA hydratase/carnithine racemase
MQQVEFSVWPAQNLKIGVIRLQNQKALNALTLDMVDAIASKLGEWERAFDIALIIIYADLPKAFCAGGDVKTVVVELLKDNQSAYSSKFFASEYKMDYMIQTYAKPILVWGNGIVMGGGMGIFCGASHGIVTEKTILAMPEIAIGFFPDVGASYFLNKMPAGVGTFLAWTAARLSGDDSIELKLAHAKILDRHRTEVFKLLRDRSWTGIGDKDKNLLSAALKPLSLPAADAPIKKYIPQITEIFVSGDAHEVAKRFTETKFTDLWFIEAQKTFLRGSPTSALVSFEQIKRAQKMNLLEIFLMEWGIARHMADCHDFREGVRARLIDKDDKPKWQPSHIEQVTSSQVERYFSSYEGENETRNFFLKR